MPEPNDIHGSEIAALLIPTTVTLVTARNASGMDRVATVAWVMPVSHEPSIIIACIRPGGETAHAIVEGGGFVINVLPAGAGSAAVACARKVADRFEQADLELEPAKVLDTVRIVEAVSWIECELIDRHVYGDHEMYVGLTKVAQTRSAVDGAGKVVPEPVLLMGQRGCFGHFEEDRT